jgi:tetratricopeptide (TPR) repeat protein
MADNQEKGITDVETSVLNTYSKAEHYIMNNKQTVTYIGTGLLVVVLGIIGFMWWKGNREKDAQAKMYQAQLWFEADSFKLAINGDAAHYGFKKIKDKFGMTKASNLCNYYLGVCYLKTGEPKTALEYLKSFSSSEEMAQSQAYSMTGDAYSETNDMKSAIEFYNKAANNIDNDMFTPFYLLKAGMAMEHEKNFKDAKEAYQKIKDKYPASQVGRMAYAYIARCEAQL